MKLTSFCCIGKEKNCTSPANEFLLQTDGHTYIDLLLDKRYSTIISTICGPNNIHSEAAYNSCIKTEFEMVIYASDSLNDRHLKIVHICIALTEGTSKGSVYDAFCNQSRKL